MGIYDKKEELTEVNIEKMKRKRKPLTKKKKIFVSLISIVLVVAIVITCIFLGKDKSDTAVYSFVRTTTLSKGTLEDSFSSTGTVKSAKTSNVTTSQNYSIKSVLVSVGDEVKEGDVLVTLDTSDLENQIEREKKNLSSSKTQAQASYDSAKASYDKAKSSLSSAKSSLEDAKVKYNSAQNSYNNVKNAVKSYQNAYDSALADYEKAGSDYVKKQSEYNSAISKYSNGKINASSLISSAKSYMSAVQNYSGGCNVGTYSISEDSSSAGSFGQMGQAEAAGSNSVQITQTANEICNGVVSKIMSLTGTTISYSAGSNTLYKLSQRLTALTQAKNSCNYTAIETTYNSIKSTYDTAKQSAEQAENTLEQAKSQYDQAKTQLENAGSSDTLEELENQLSNCNLKAEQDGTVTALNATVGSSASSAMGGNAIATISDLNKLIVSVTIAEANINKAKIGMSCYITSDASNETLNGTLTQIDPVAGDSGSFSAEVTVDSPTSDLKVGMNASVEMLVSAKENVFQVPIDAVGNDENGDFVYRHTSGEGTDMEFDKVYVTTGESNDYYVEISSSDLSEGDVIRSSSDLTQGIEDGAKNSKDSSTSLFGSMFGGSAGPQGMGGGNMPGGGDFTPPSGNGTGSSGITVSDGILYTGCAAAVTALDIENGEIIWENIRNHGEGSPAELIVTGDKVIVSSHWDALAALDKKTGKKLWENKDGDIRFRSSTPAEVDENTLLVADSNAIMIVNSVNGEIVHKTTLEDYNFSSSAQPVINNNLAYIPTANKGVVAYNLDTYQIEWNAEVGKAMIYTAPYTSGDAQTVEPTLLLHDDVLIFGASDGVLYMLSAMTGEIIKTENIGAPVFSSCAVIGEDVIITDYNARVIRINDFLKY